MLVASLLGLLDEAPLLKTGEEKDNKYSVEWVLFTLTAFHQHSPRGEAGVGGDVRP